MKTKLSILTVVLFLMTTPAFAKIYQVVAFETSLPTIADWVGEDPVGDEGDVIAQLGVEQAWFCFNLTEIPDSGQILAASFSIRIRDFAVGYATERTLWYDTEDSWANSWPHDPDFDEVRIPDELVSVEWFNIDGWTWVTFEIDISKHDWSDDLTDNYVTLMLTGSLSGFYTAAECDFREAYLELETLGGGGSGGSSGSEVDVNAILNLGPVEFVQANGIDIEVPGYSVPSFVDWNNDNLKDLVVGQGGGREDGKVRIYLNVGTESEPQFSDYFYAQSNGSDLTCRASSGMGCFPRVDYWDNDGRKDLLIGQADGKIKIFLNIGTDEEPIFDGGTELRTGNKVIDVGRRATPTVVDWNNDGAKDLVVGAFDGKIHIFSNGSSIPPNFNSSQTSGDFAIGDRNALKVPGGRSSPVIMDLDGDGIKDILTGNADGELLLYSNIGTNNSPSFSDYTLIESDGVLIDLAGRRSHSRPSVCYWTSDGYVDPIDVYPDVLIGSEDGKIRLYRGMPLEVK